jgi:thiol-disulfide isomerase/thioredoxin
MKRFGLALAMICCAVACGERAPSGAPPGGDDAGVERRAARLLPEGPWRGVIEMQGKELPFQMAVVYPPGDGGAGVPQVDFINGAERVPVARVEIEGERVSLIMPVYQTRIDGRFEKGRIEGTLARSTRSSGTQQMPVTITAGESHRFFRTRGPAGVDVSGRWQVVFTKPDGNGSPAVGELRQEGDEVFGTFLTPTSDHRYLAGAVRDGRLYLSAWDGSHVFLYEAEVREDGTLAGEFWSGTSWHQTWTARRDAAAALPDMDAQTYLKPGYETFDFTFPDLEGRPVSLSDARFAGKVVIVQIAGSWCPNCADEARFLAPWYRANRDRGVEVVALMFEYFEDFEKAAAQVRVWRELHGVEYPTLIAGISDKQDASSRLPQINALLAYPTTIYIGKDGKVARIHTGFNGPATGAHHEEEVRKLEATVDALLGDRP